MYSFLCIFVCVLLFACVLLLLLLFVCLKAIRYCENMCANRGLQTDFEVIDEMKSDEVSANSYRRMFLMLIHIVFVGICVFSRLYGTWMFSHLGTFWKISIQISNISNPR